MSTKNSRIARRTAKRPAAEKKTAATAKVSSEHIEAAAAARYREQNETDAAARRQARSAQDRTAQALEDLAMLAGEIAVADSERVGDVRIKDLEEASTAGCLRRALLAQVLTISASVAGARYAARRSLELHDDLADLRERSVSE